jgi:BirA family biotin operon repressor/biotin-[acetyl-CoA-carboxylase] ligase
MGINVNSVSDDWDETVRARGASCRTLTGSEWDRAFFLADVLGTVEAYYDRFRRDGFAPLVSAYQARLWQMDRVVTFRRAGAQLAGVVTGVAADGALRVRLDADGSTVELYNESVEVVP